jgi:hypothetical protein
VIFFCPLRVAVFAAPCNKIGYIGRSLFLLALLFSLCSCASYPFQGWTANNTALELTGTALQAADWSQTRWIASHGSNYHEINPLLGPHPSDGTVNTYFLGSALFRLALSSSLRDPYRTWTQYLFIVTSGGLVAHNASIGAGFRW